MDPFSFSLLSLGVSGMAVRRVVRRMEETAAAAEAALPPSDEAAAATRMLLLHAVAEASVRAAAGREACAARAARTLVRLPRYEGLSVEVAVPLDRVFECQGTRVDARRVLSRHRMDAVVYDRAGEVRAALCQTGGSEGRDEVDDAIAAALSQARPRAGCTRLARRLSQLTRLPMACLQEGLPWREAMEGIDRAFGLQSGTERLAA